MPSKVTQKNVIKNLVKENQRIHDYKSPFGVKFWNKILRDSKAYGHNHKVFSENIMIVINKDYERYTKMLETETDSEKIEVLERKIYQLSFFLDDRWKNLIDRPTARLYPDKRDILWKENAVDKEKYERK